MRLTAKEWIQLTPEQEADAIQNYANSFSQDESYQKFAIFGKRPVRQLLSVEGAKGLKVISSLFQNVDTGKLQFFPILCAVDRHGNRLPLPDDFDFDEDNDSEGDFSIMGDSNPPVVRCPAACS